MIKFFSGPPMHNRSLKMIGVKNGRNIDLQLKPISSGDLVVTVSKDQSISQHSREEHWKNTDKTQIWPHKKHKKRQKAMIMENDQLSQINFPTWERMQKLEDSATAPCH